MFFSGNSSASREFPTGIGANGKPVDSCEICSKTWQISAVFTVQEKITMEKKEKKNLRLNSMLPFDRQLSNLWPKLLSQYHIYYFELLSFYKSFWRRKNSGGCLLKTKFLMKKLNKNLMSVPLPLKCKFSSANLILEGWFFFPPKNLSNERRSN